MGTTKYSDLTGRTVANGKITVDTAKIQVNGESFEIDLATDELAALLSLLGEGHNAAPLRALLATETATAATVKATAVKSKTPADTGALESVQAWVKETDGLPDVKVWANANGFPQVKPGKGGRIAADVWFAFGRAHGCPEAPAAPVDSATPAADADKTPARKVKGNADDAGKPLTDAESAAFAALTADKPDNPA